MAPSHVLIKRRYRVLRERSREGVYGVSKCEPCTEEQVIHRVRIQ